MTIGDLKKEFQNNADRSFYNKKGDSYKGDKLVLDITHNYENGTYENVKQKNIK